jgi:hypothetical protein
MVTSCSALPHSRQKRYPYAFAAIRLLTNRIIPQSWTRLLPGLCRGLGGCHALEAAGASTAMSLANGEGGIMLFLRAKAIFARLARRPEVLLDLVSTETACQDQLLRRCH